MGNGVNWQAVVALVATLVGILGSIIAGLSWLMRLQGRMDMMERQRVADLELAAAQRRADTELTGERLANINHALDSINGKLDGLEQMKRKVDQIRSFMGNDPARG